MKVKDLLDYFEEIAPLHLQESYDNGGLLVGDPEMEITGLITCLDSTQEIIEEAIAKSANVVVAHHPIIFQGLKNLTNANYIQKTIQLAIKYDIAIIAMHTNLDNVFQNGVNQRIANQLELTDIQILRPKDPEITTVGSGMIGNTPEALSPLEYLHLVKDKMKVNCVKYTALLDQKITKVAVAGGSGGFLLEDAIKQGAQLFITSDYKYHEFFDANSRIIIADIGHYESEQFTIPLLCELISDKFTTFAAHCTEKVTNPVNYL